MENLVDLLREEIGKVNPKDREGRTWGELIVQATLLLAVKGNATALKILWQTFGLPDGDNDGGKDQQEPRDADKKQDEEVGRYSF